MRGPVSGYFTRLTCYSKHKTICHHHNKWTKTTAYRLTSCLSRRGYRHKNQSIQVNWSSLRRLPSTRSLSFFYNSKPSVVTIEAEALLLNPGLAPIEPEFALQIRRIPCLLAMYPCSSLLHSSNSFELSDYLTFSDTQLQEEYLTTPTSEQKQSPFHLQENGDHVSKRSTGVCSKNHNMVKNTSKGSSIKVAFKTKSELEVLDDGYKWRKYGKKMVKNSPNPRNYYRCSTKGCFVKKRVEREREDSRYVITTYEGIHNHHVPSKTNSQ